MLRSQGGGVHIRFARARDEYSAAAGGRLILVFRCFKSRTVIVRSPLNNRGLSGYTEGHEGVERRKSHLDSAEARCANGTGHRPLLVQGRSVYAAGDHAQAGPRAHEHRRKNQGATEVQGGAHPVSSRSPQRILYDRST